MVHFVVIALVVAVVAAACGGRSSGKSSPTTATTSGSSTSGSTGGGGNADPDTPCGPGDAKGTTDKGVTDSDITISTIQDISGPRPGLFQGNKDAMDAFVAYCNSLGGVNGRKLTLNALDSALLSHKEKAVEACGSFAIVGQAAALDGGGAQPAVDCGIPDIPAFTAEALHAGAINVVQPLPNPISQLAVGMQRYIAKKHPSNVKHAAMMFVNLSVSQVTARKRIEGYGKVGYHYDYQQPIAIAELNWGPEIEAFRSKNIGVFDVVSDLTNLVGLEKALRTQNVTGAIGESDQSGYDQGFIDSVGPAGEGTYVIATTVPFEEKSTSREMQLFLEWLQKVKPGATPTALGVQGWSAGLLFATALKSLGSDVTRAKLMDALHAIHQWDGHGIHAPSDPGAGKASGCFAALRVKGGKFVREYPDKGFACDPKNVITLTGDYGKGAGR
jgi:ABC-type branched-subunit amino acid transport system substrate-binding protein